MKHLQNDFKLTQSQNQYDASEVLDRVSQLRLIGNSVAKHVGLIPMACLNCPFLRIELNCNQCNRWNQQE